MVAVRGVKGLRGDVLDEAVGNVLLDPLLNRVPKKVWKMLWLLKERYPEQCYDLPADIIGVVLECVVRHDVAELNVSLIMNWGDNMRPPSWNRSSRFRCQVTLPHPARRLAGFNIGVLCPTPTEEVAARAVGFTPISNTTITSCRHQRKRIKKLLQPFSKLMCIETSIPSVIRVFGPTIARVRKMPTPYSKGDNLRVVREKMLRTFEASSRLTGCPIGHTGLTHEMLKENITAALQELMPFIPQAAQKVKVGLMTSFGRYQPLIGPCEARPPVARECTAPRTVWKPDILMYHVVNDSLPMVRECLRAVPSSMGSSLCDVLQLALRRSDSLDIVKELLFNDNIILSSGSNLVMSALRSKVLVVEKVALLLNACPQLHVCDVCVEYCHEKKSPEVIRGFTEVLTRERPNAWRHLWGLSTIKTMNSLLVRRQYGLDEGPQGLFSLQSMLTLFAVCRRRGVDSSLAKTLRDMLGTREETLFVKDWLKLSNPICEPEYYYDSDWWFDPAPEVEEEEEEAPLYFRTDRSNKTVETKPACTTKFRKRAQCKEKYNYNPPPRPKRPYKVSKTSFITHNVTSELSYCSALLGR